MTDSSLPPDPEIEEALVTDIFLGTVQEDGTFGDVEFTPPSADITEDIKVDQTESTFEEATVQIGDGSCIVCGAPTFRPPGLTKAGHKKRTPKYCDLHDPKLRVQKDGPVIAGMENQLKRVQEELADDLRLLGVMAGPLFPVTGVYVFENADPFTVALLKLCKNNQRALRVLHRAASVAPIYEVAKDCAGVFYAVQVDMHKLDPNNTVSQRLGVQRAYNTVYPDNETNVANNGNLQGPPRYATT